MAGFEGAPDAHLSVLRHPDVVFGGQSGESQTSQVALVVKNLPANAGDVRDAGSIPGSGRSPGEGNGNPAPVFQPVESHGQTSLVGYSPWGRKELDTTE